MQMYFGRFVLPTVPLTLPRLVSEEELKEVQDPGSGLLSLLDDLGMSEYVDYDAMVYRRSGRARKQRDLLGCGVYTG